MDLLIWIHGYTSPLVHSVDCETKGEALDEAIEIGRSGFVARGPSGFIYFPPHLIVRIEYHTKVYTVTKENEGGEMRHD